jgi:hypothetical protein
MLGQIGISLLRTPMMSTTKKIPTHNPTSLNDPPPRKIIELNYALQQQM